MKEKNRVLVVLGGSGGIGLAVVRKAVADGYSVAIGYHNSSKVALAMCDDLMSQGHKVRAWRVDVSDVTSVEKFFTLVKMHLGVPGGMIFAAGISGRLEALIEASSESVARIVNINLLGAFYALQSASRLMVHSRGGVGGSIVIVTSEAGKHGGARMSAYAASKAGLNAMILGAARELATEGVRLNGISPGVIDTNQHAEISDSRRLSLLSSIPLGRMGTPEEVANAVLWLISEEASYVVGSVLSINGGR